MTRLDSPPSSLGLYAKAALGSVPGLGSLPVVGAREDDVPDIELELGPQAADPDRVAAYARVCGFTLRDTLPPTYPHILAFPLHMQLLTDRRFPFGPVGLVHIANRITQHRPVRISEELDLRVSATKLEPHPKGRQFSLVTEARVDGELVWESLSTNLRRGGGSDAERDGENRFADPADLTAGAEWKLPGDLGRSYAGVSGDRNPIHMYGLTAKAFGFPRQIAHGMWTKARCLAALEGDLPDSLTVEVRFLKPILLPGRVTFASVRDAPPLRFGVRDARKPEVAHLTGVLDAA